MGRFFHKIRWIIMTGSFLFLVFGLRILGHWIEGIEIPVFSCPANTDQVIHSACYYLSHLNELWDYNTVQELVWYFLTLIVLILIFGRVFCGFICPMGYFQDIAYQIREILHIEGISRNEKWMEVLSILKYCIVFAFLGITFMGFNFCNICPAVITSPMFAGFQHAITVGYLFTIIIFVLGFFMRRFWCTICPLGFIVGLFSKVSLFKVKKDCGACTKCGACYEACPMRIKDVYLEDEKKDVTKSECIFCGECVKKCPEDGALAISIGKKKLYVSSRDNFYRNQRGGRKSVIHRRTKKRTISK